MQQRSGTRELGLAVATLGVLIHFVDAAAAAAVTACLVGLAAAGTLSLMGAARPGRLPVIPIVLPAATAFAIAGVARLVDPVPWLAVVFIAGWVATAWVAGLETAPIAEAGAAPTEARPAPPLRVHPVRRAEFDLPKIVAEPLESGPEVPVNPRDVAVRSACLGLAFAALTAVGGVVPGGLADGSGVPGIEALALTVALEALVGGFIGYRLASIDRTSRFDRMIRVLAFLQYAIPVGLFGGLLRVVGLPRLFGPALLTLIVYMVTILRESPEPVLLNRRLVQEIVVLVVVGAVAVLWGLLVR